MKPTAAAAAATNRSPAGAVDLLAGQVCRATPQFCGARPPTRPVLARCPGRQR